MIEDFYPTPPALITKMLENVSFSTIKTLLEPSAGKGDICDFIKDRRSSTYQRCTIDFDVIEINPELQMILKGKEYRLIADDFREFRTHKNYDLLIANFPFSEGSAHLRRALNLIKSNGGQLICLVNAETIRNPYSAERTAVVNQLEAMNADIEYLEDQFMCAERPTNVEVALINVTAPPPAADSLILENLKRERDIEAGEYAQTAIVEKNYINQAIAGFNVECELGVKLIDEYFALKPHIRTGFVTPGASDYTSEIIEMKIGNSYQTRQSYINEYLQKVRRKYWQVLTNDSRFAGKYTSNILDDLSRKLTDLAGYDFTLFNIRELEQEMAEKISRGIEDSILSMFDEFSRQFAWGEDFSANIHYYNGWKTNKAHKINSKIILPINGFASYSYGGKKKMDDYYIGKRLRDMVKVFNYLSDEQVNVHRLVGQRIEASNDAQKFTNLDFRYFEATFYKKGTCHIKFKNQDLLDKLNIYGSQRKGWLPPAYGKTSYDEMDEASRAVVDEFQGREKYDEVMQNTYFYIVEPARLLLEEKF